MERKVAGTPPQAFWLHVLTHCAISLHVDLAMIWLILLFNWTYIYNTWLAFTEC